MHGLYVALNTAFLSGCEIIWFDKFDVKALMAAMPGATMMMGVPTFYTRLLSEEGFTRETAKDMRLFISGSAPLLAETHAAFSARTGHAILERYGMTETGMITSNPYDGARVPGTVGFALPGVDVRIRGEQPGVLEVKGPNVFKGYWRMPEKTREDFTADGFFITGDVATIAADGRVTIAGRAKDLIISGGFNVYPKEIEEALDAFPGVGESAVIGVPHPDFGEGVVAVVTTRGPLAPEAEIIAALSRSLAQVQGAETHLRSGRTAAQRHGQGAEGGTAQALCRELHHAASHEGNCRMTKTMKAFTSAALRSPRRLRLQLHQR